MARVLAIGDIHGCIHALDAVLTAVDLQSDDTLVVLGDVIDYGHESAMVIECLIELQSQCHLVCIRGNHEEMLLEALELEELKSQWLNLGGVETLNSYKYLGGIDVIPSSHITFLRGFLNYYETENHLFTHAGYDADLPFNMQPSHVLRWRSLKPPYPKPHCSGKTVVVGHTEQHSGEILDLGHVVGIDTACRSYGWLTAWDSDSGQIWQASMWGMLREREDQQEIAALQQAKRILRIDRLKH